MVDINNAGNYKNCFKKQYEIWVCKPPKGTVVINKFEQYASMMQLGVSKDSCCFSVDTLNKLKSVNDARFGIIQNLVNTGGAYVVNDKTPFVLSGTEGEMWAVAGQKLAQTYNFLENGQPVQITDSILSRRCDADGNLPWFKVRTKPTQGAQTMACFVPVAQKAKIPTSWGAMLDVNGAGVQHGKGDFIVCAKMPNGQPNLGDRLVVNGLIFGSTYNNQGWTANLANSVQGIKDVPRPKELFTPMEKKQAVVSKDLFTKKCDTLVKDLHDILKFSVKSKDFYESNGFTGFAKEVELKGTCYHMEYMISGNFSYDFKEQGKGVVSTTETGLWFTVSADNKDSAIYMSIVPESDRSGLFSGYSIPYGSKYDRTKGYILMQGTIDSINCAKEVEILLDKLDKCKLAFIDNRINVNNSSSPLFNAYIKLMDRFKSGVKEDGNICWDVKWVSLGSIGSMQKSIGDDVKTAYNYYLNNKIKETDSGNPYARYLEKFIQTYNEFGMFNGMDGITFNNEVIQKSKIYDKVLFFGIKPTKQSEKYSYYDCIMYRYLPYKSPDGKDMCFVFIFDTGYVYNDYDDIMTIKCVESDVMSEGGFAMYATFEAGRLEILKSKLKTDAEKYKEYLFGAYKNVTNFAGRFNANRYSLEEYEYWADADDRDASKLPLVCVGKYLYKSEYKTLGMYIRSSMLAGEPMNDDSYPCANYILCCRIVIDIFLLYLMRSSGSTFFHLHPLTELKFESDAGEFCMRIRLRDGHEFNVSTSHTNGKKVEISIRKYHHDTFDTLNKLVLDTKNLKDCYDVIDRTEDAINIESLHTVSGLRGTDSYEKIRTGFVRFIKPRKPSKYECVWTLIDFCRLFSNQVVASGCHILVPFGEFMANTTSNKITIDGDNDNKLTLFFSLVFDKEYLGLRVSGRSDNNKLSYICTLVNDSKDSAIGYKGNEHDERSTESLTELSKWVMDYVCKTLGISVYRKLCTQDFITRHMPFSASDVDVSKRNIVTYRVDAYNAKVAYKISVDKLEIRVTSNGTTVGDELNRSNLETVNTVGSTVLQLLLKISNSIDEATIATVMSLYQAKDYGYDSNLFFRSIRSVSCCTIVMANGDDTMVSVVNDDNTVTSTCVFFTEPVTTSVNTFVDNCVKFFNASHYYHVH